MTTRWIGVLLVTGTLALSGPAQAAREVYVDPITGRTYGRSNCIRRLDGPEPPPLPTSNDVLVPSGGRTVWLKLADVTKAKHEIANANGKVWEQPAVLPIATATGTVTLDYFDAWTKATEFGKHGPRLEAWGQQQAISRGATPAEFTAALATWKQSRQAAAQQEIQRIEQRFFDKTGVTLQEASKAAGFKK